MHEKELDEMTSLMNDFVHALETEVTEALDLELAELVILTFSEILDALETKKR